MRASNGLGRIVIRCRRQRGFQLFGVMYRYGRFCPSSFWSCARRPGGAPAYDAPALLPALPGRPRREVLARIATASMDDQDTWLTPWRRSCASLRIRPCLQQWRRGAVCYLLDTQARPSAIGLHAPLQQSASAVQGAPAALQAASCRSGVDLVAPPCPGKRAVTVLCGDCSDSSRSHAAAGKAATQTKSAKKSGETARIRMITSLDTGFVEQYTIAMPRRSVKKRSGTALGVRNSFYARLPNRS
jgi:hypothetical protein